MSHPSKTEPEPSTEPVSDSTHYPADTNRSLRWGAYLIAVSGIGLIVNGVAMLYRVFYSAGFEAGVDTLGGVTKAELAATNYELLHYINHLHVNVAGLMMAVGIGVVALAWYGVRRGQKWAWATAIALPVVFLAHSLPVHQTAGFSFDAVLHLGPGAVWLPALIAGAVVAYRGLHAVDRSPGEGEKR